MFKQRLITALVLIPLVLWCLYQANSWILAGVLSLIVLALGWEWTALIPLQRGSTKIVFMVLTLGLTWLMTMILDVTVVLDMCLWLVIIGAILTYPNSQSWWGSVWVVGGVAIYLIALFGSSFWALYFMPKGIDSIVYVLCLVWATDIGAYLAGKQFGRYRLIPNVSPGKTREGALGGLSMAALVAMLGLLYFHPITKFLWFGQALVIIIVAMFGDLFISMLKRRCNLKDTGHILPGHGGILDRLDSLIAVLPFFYYFHQGSI